MELPIFSILILIGVVLLVSIRQINEYQRGVLFTLGKYTKILNPGWRIVIPVLQSMVKVDLRVRTVDVPNQESLTKDNIPVGVNAVLYFRVKDPNKAIIHVENFYYATSQLAQTTMRNAVGEVVLDKLLSDRDEISEGIRIVVDKMTDDWGIEIVNVELKDIIIPENMKRTIAKEAEAERERRAVIIKAEGEVESATNMAKAAQILGTAPGALHLRTLQSVNDLSSDQSNTTVWMLPVEVLRGFEGIIPKK
ncbi:slipin family protein [Candidatus Peregrinibacteria bacterium]|jgi:regulator of protease activity HflC (stomatin/prohibitin superfamily)|nr:slipin family protein [Candidatus Peregrinibacteria bacterium]